MTTVRYPSLVFDLAGTLIDSVSQHVLAWREILDAAGLYLVVWRIHRRIGMSGGLLVHALLREPHGIAITRRLSHSLAMIDCHMALHGGSITCKPSWQMLAACSNENALP